MTIAARTMKVIRIVIGTAIGAELFLFQALPARAALPRKVQDKFYAVYNSTSATPAAKMRAWRLLSVNNSKLPPPHLIWSARPSTSTVSGFILADKGGRLARADNTAIAIPPGALAADLRITVSTPTVSSVLEAALQTRKMMEANLVAASAGVSFGPEGTTFSVPVTLVLPYDPAALAAGGLKENDLKIYYWNGSTLDWEPLNSTVDVVDHTVSAPTAHFSLYQVLASPGTSSTLAASTPQAAVSAFGLISAYVFPNPVRGTRQATIRIQPGLADSVEVHIYDLTGRDVHSSSDFSESTTDDGNGLGPQFTFDHVWDVSGVGSGVYAYAITARKAGQADIHVSGKIAIVK